MFYLHKKICISLPALTKVDVTQPFLTLTNHDVTQRPHLFYIFSYLTLPDIKFIFKSQNKFQC